VGHVSVCATHQTQDGSLGWTRWQSLLLTLDYELTLPLEQTYRIVGFQLQFLVGCVFHHVGVTSVGKRVCSQRPMPWY